MDIALTQQLHAPAPSADFDAQLHQRIAAEYSAVKQIGLAEKRRALEAEYAASQQRRNLRQWTPRLLDVLGYGVAGGMGGWIVAALLSQTNALWTTSFALTGPQMLVVSSSVGIIIALGLAVLAFGRSLRRTLLR